MGILNMSENISPYNQQTTSRKFRTLVVDDNFYNIFALSSMLEQYQIQSDTATDG